MVASDEKSNAAVRSVDRALLVLELLARSGQAGVTEIAGELGVHKSTVSRLIAVLESRGYVEQVTGRGKYRLGFSIARLARTSSGHRDLV
jgi:CRISPR locus-related DNA-binding protein